MGGDENDRGHARQFIAILTELALRHECAVLVLAHPSLVGMASGSGLSGSTAWNNSVRSRLYLERLGGRDQSDADPDARRLSTKKTNHAPLGWEARLVWKEGVFVPRAAETLADRAGRLEHTRRVFLKLLRELSAEGRDVNATSGKTYAPLIFERDPRAEGLKKKAMEEAMSSLFAEKRIRVDEFGPPSRRRRRIVEVEPEA
jgi:RecA-family ATPase